MHPVNGPRQPVSINPNGKPDYAFNPIENLSVEECAPWEHDSYNVEYLIEPIFSSQARATSSPENVPNS